MLGSSTGTLCLIKQPGTSRVTRWKRTGLYTLRQRDTRSAGVHTPRGFHSDARSQGVKPAALAPAVAGIAIADKSSASPHASGCTHHGTGSRRSGHGATFTARRLVPGATRRVITAFLLRARSHRQPCACRSLLARSCAATMSALHFFAGACSAKAHAPCSLNARCVRATARRGRCSCSRRVTAQFVRRARRGSRCPASRLGHSLTRGLATQLRRLRWRPPAALRRPAGGGCQAAAPGGASRPDATRRATYSCACERLACAAPPRAEAPRSPRALLRVHTGPGEGQEAGARLGQPERPPAVRARPAPSRAVTCLCAAAAWAMRNHLLSSEKTRGVSADTTLFLTRGALLGCFAATRPPPG